VHKLFVLANNLVVRADTIEHVDISEIEKLKIVLHHSSNKRTTVTGIQAIEILMALKPSALENRRLKWKKYAWTLHNMIGHPVMQILAFFRMYDYAMMIHDKTVPKPIGRK
jgi:hypothetical protein